MNEIAEVIVILTTFGAIVGGALLLQGILMAMVLAPIVWVIVWVTRLVWK